MAAVGEVLTRPIRELRYLPYVLWIAIRSCSFFSGLRGWNLRQSNECGYFGTRYALRISMLQIPIVGPFLKLGFSLEVLKTAIRWAQNDWERFTLSLLWKICQRDAVRAGLEQTKHRTTLLHARDLLLEVNVVDTDFHVQDILFRFVLAFGASLGLGYFAAKVRSSIFPWYSWTADLFEKTSVGTAVLFRAPLTGVYMVMRFVFPMAPDWQLHTIALLSLFTAIAASRLVCVQVEIRHLFSDLFLINATLVLSGSEFFKPLGLTGGLCVWLSLGIALIGLSLVLRGIETRLGQLRLDNYPRLFDQIPHSAGFLFLTGLASIGFLGAIGFVPLEMLIGEAVCVFSMIGRAVVMTSNIHGATVRKIYFRLFNGQINRCLLPLKARTTKRVTIRSSSALIAAAGFWPQPSVTARQHAAIELNLHRKITVIPPHQAECNAHDRHR